MEENAEMTNENVVPFKVNKVGVIICMIENMALGIFPYFWYKREVAVNEAYGYENMDSFNYIGERMAECFLPLSLAVPLSLVYLFCLRGVKTYEGLFVISMIPFLPWFLGMAFATLISFGFMFLATLIVTLPLIFFIGSRLVFLNGYSCIAGKKIVPSQCLLAIHIILLVLVLYIINSRVCNLYYLITDYFSSVG